MQRSFTSSVVRDDLSAPRVPRHDDDPRVAQPELLRWLRARLRTPHDALRAAVFVLCGVLLQGVHEHVDALASTRIPKLKLFRHRSHVHGPN